MGKYHRISEFTEKISHHLSPYSIADLKVLIK